MLGRRAAAGRTAFSAHVACAAARLYAVDVVAVGLQDQSGALEWLQDARSPCSLTPEQRQARVSIYAADAVPGALQAFVRTPAWHRVVGSARSLVVRHAFCLPAVPAVAASCDPYINMQMRSKLVLDSQQPLDAETDPADVGNRHALPARAQSLMILFRCCLSLGHFRINSVLSL